MKSEEELASSFAYRSATLESTPGERGRDRAVEEDATTVASLQAESRDQPIFRGSDTAKLRLQYQNLECSFRETINTLQLIDRSTRILRFVVVF